MTDAVISIRNVSFSYDKKKNIYDNFSLDISENDIFFIMGVNGCGKTTLLKLIGSFLKADKGEILVNQKEIDDYDSKSLSRLVAYVPQTIHLNSDFLVKDYLAMGRTPYKGLFEDISKPDYELVEKYARELDVDRFLDTEFNTLSGGQKQNVAICRAMVQETPIIIMDEPMSALDIGKQADFLGLILKLKNEGKTIVLTSHNPNHAFAVNAECKVCLLQNGNVLGLGSCNDVLSKSNIENIYGKKVIIDEEKHQVEFNLR